MKRITKTLLATCLVATCFLQCSCSLFLYDNTRFSGGELLNDNLIDEIKSELFASDTKSEQQSVEDSSDLKKEDKTENTEGVFIESDVSSDNENVSKPNQPMEKLFIGRKAVLFGTLILIAVILKIQIT